jgi:hypothetical protein
VVKRASGGLTLDEDERRVVAVQMRWQLEHVSSAIRGALKSLPAPPRSVGELANLVRTSHATLLSRS